MSLMKRTALVSLTLGFAALGLIDAGYLLDTALTGASLVCNIQGLDGCNTVAKSAYSFLFGIPLAAYGVVFYAGFVVLALVAYYKRHRILTALLALGGVVGVLASIVFMYIQLVLIQAVCVYCLGSAVISAFLFITTLLLFQKERKESATPAPVLSPTTPS